MRILGLLLDVRYDGPDSLDDGDDERAEGRRAGMVEERRLNRANHGPAPDCILVAAEVPCCHRHSHHDLSQTRTQAPTRASREVL